MSTPDHKRIAESWLTMQRHWWAYDAVCKIVQVNPQEALALIVLLLDLASSPEDFSDIGCGPLEQLLSLHAAEVIDSVESLATNSEQLRRALSHVWFSQGDAALNQRLGALGCQILSVRRADDA